MATTADELTTLVSLFHTSEHAGKALSDLQAAGIPANVIQTLAGQGAQSSGPEQSLTALQSLNLPSKDLQVLSDGLKSGGTLIVVRATHAVSEKAEDVLERHHARQIDERTAAVQPRAAAAFTTGDAVIPVVEESLVVGKRKVKRGGVRVFSRLVETPVEEEIVLREEHATIERHPVNRPVSPADIGSFRDQTIEVREMDEEAVVGKTARIVEEVSVSKSATERTEQIKDTVRKTEVEVDQIVPDEKTTTKRKS